MQTRIIHTKIYDDEWFSSLTLDQKFLFVYLFTNQRIGLSGIYYLPDRIIQFETSITQEQLQKAKKVFEDAKKVFFYKGWVYVTKASEYGGYKGAKNQIALDNEIKKIPDEVKKYFNDRLSIGYLYPIDSPINHKSEIINQKSKNIGEELLREGEEDDKTGADVKVGEKENTSSISSLIQQKIKKLQEKTPKNGISNSWQEKAFRYANSLKIDLNEEFKARWLKVFKQAYEGRNPKNIELAYSYLSDYPRPLSNDAKIKLFFWIYEHGLPKAKFGFISSKILIFLGVTTLVLGLIFFMAYKTNQFFEKNRLVFQPPIKIKIQPPIQIVKRKEKIVYIREFIKSLPQPKTPIEKYICNKFGSECQIALAVAQAESGIREEAIGINKDGSIDMGIFQINSIHWQKPGCNPKSLLDAYKNTDCAYQIWKSSGWYPWVAFQSGRWLSIANGDKK